MSAIAPPAAPAAGRGPAPQAPPSAGSAAERPYARAIAVVFAGAVAFRLVLALLNLEANDDHMAVSRVMAFEGRSPAADELYQAYHPKLYHGAVALVWRALPDRSLPAATRAAQLLNVAAGVLTLAVVLRFLRRLGLAPRVRFLAFALVALNPRLASINVQAANDSFAILFGTLALYAAYRFFEAWDWAGFLGLWGAAVLAMLSKANGLILLIAVLVTFGAAAVRGRTLAPVGRGRVVVSGALFLAAYLATVPWLGPYARHYREKGTPFPSNHDLAPFPHLFRETRYGRPGATSVAHALLTFRYVDLLRHPMNTQDRTVYPAHRTSLWSQLYGRLHFAQFEYHPPSWRTRHPAVLWLGRVIFVAALVPTVVALCGLWRAAIRTARAWLGRGGPSALAEGILPLTVAGFLAAIALYALRQRTFASMNAIYILPAALAMVALFAREYQRWSDRLGRHSRARRALDGTVAALLVLYAADLAALAYQLR